MDQSIAPIKAEFWGRPSTLADSQAEAPEAVSKPKVSRRQQKRDRKGQAANRLCHSFMKDGTCAFGDGCRFSHDVDRVIEIKPRALPGRCPYSSLETCPFGPTCGRYDFSKAAGTLRQLQDDSGHAHLAKIWDVVAHQQGGESNADLMSHQREKPRLDLRGKLYLAPLTTVGNLPFRRICKGWGADVTCGEMAMCTNLLQGQSSEWALLKRDSSEDLFGVQICGGYMDTMTRCAQLLEDQIDVNFVDVNCGCPIDLVCNKGGGSALLQKPERLEGVMRGVSTRLSCPVTLKLRTGVSQSHDVAHTLLPRISSWGVAAATLHGRSRHQRYSGKANWDYIGRCAEAAPQLQLVGNGDIFSFTDYEEHIAKTPQLASVMIARGALMKPWLFTEIKERRHWDISSGERLDMLKRFCSFGLVHWGSDSRGVENTRRFLLEWLSYLYRYIPIALLDVVPQQLNWRAPAYVARNDLEVLMSSEHPSDWIKISEMLLGPAPEGMRFTPKHKSSAYPPTTAPRDAEQENG
ncbi:hypothetical protein WJX73_005882 [Symbiochloris irregularis]|uniref:tRNA-dihydrouridine(47) synthase [NAD(P)(+)] n=1 Tax=Symbiochloris irregularis TaxID=706552 RepID=A0AAW1NTA9_9CHLO